MIKAAGVLYYSDGNVLFVKRSSAGDHAGEWCIPGGKVEDGEDNLTAALRESQEEVGHAPTSLDPRYLATLMQDDVSFATFLVRSDAFVPVLNDEHTEFTWAPYTAPPQPLHPGLVPILELLPKIVGTPGRMNELEIARGIVAGLEQSPYQYENMWLVAMRITGTGAAYRKKDKEYVYRSPEHYLTEEFLARCNGLIVIWEHPEGAKVTQEDFEERIVGTIMLPYIRGDEVWGIAKIYDAEAARLLATEELSTSPAVFFRDMTVNQTTKLADGSTLFVEGVPSLLDHLAICERGVWDKGGAPSGIISETRKDSTSMTDEEKAAAAAAAAKDKKDADDKQMKLDAEKEEDRSKLDKLLAGVDACLERMDRQDARLDAIEAKGKTDSEKEAEAAAAKDKKDAEEMQAAKDKKDAEETQAKKDSDDRHAARDAEIAALKARLPRADDDADLPALATAQSRADAVMGMFGEHAPRPMNGESVVGYRRRILGKLQGHSAEWKGVDVSTLDGTVLDVAETRVYADAAYAAEHPQDLPVGTLRMIERADETGRKIKTFHGDISSWMSQFRVPPRRLARPLFRTQRADARS